MELLSFYKIDGGAHNPEFGTLGAACFDFKALVKSGDEITYFTQHNVKSSRGVQNNAVMLLPRERYMIPTGLILDIPAGYSVRLHPRSGLSLKNGLGLSNMEGVIDHDYVEPVFILIENRSDVAFNLTDGMRICQGELVQTVEYALTETTTKPEVKTDRIGGFGHTGV